jgi:hypothetical protein
VVDAARRRKGEQKGARRRYSGLTDERFNEGFKAGTFYNIDPKTGKSAKKKRR